MAISLYDASIPQYLRMMRNLLAWLDKAEAHAKAQGRDVQAYLDARLAPDMHPLSRQIQMVSDGAKGAAARLAGVEPPSMPDVEITLDELRERIARTIAFVETADRAAIEAAEDRTIELKFPNGSMSFSGRDFLFNFSLPNFMFHVTIAYALLRQQGVPLGKMDFLAGGQG